MLDVTNHLAHRGVPGRTVGETAAAAARTRAAKANVAETAAFVRAAGGTAGVGGVATDAIAPSNSGDDKFNVYDGNRRDLSHLRGTLRRRDDVWVTFTKIKEQVEAVLTDPEAVRCPHVVGTDRNQWRRAPHVAVSERVAPSSRLEISGRSSGAPSSVVARGGSVRRKVYCAECWEKMEVKRAASVVRCADCGDRFPLSKTAPFPVRRTLGLVGAAGKISSTCAFCAPRGGSRGGRRRPRAGARERPGAVERRGCRRGRRRRGAQGDATRGSPAFIARDARRTDDEDGVEEEEDEKGRRGR